MVCRIVASSLRKRRKFLTALLLNRAPATAMFVIYCAAFVVLTVGVLTLLTLDDLMDRWFEDAVGHPAERPEERSV